ncbi:MAG: acyl-[acyl-carrier-protein] thioesterase [Omnitrophica WOR_2 bacterium]
MMNNYFDISYELRHFELNRFGEASPTLVLALLEEAAAEHCQAIGYGLYDLLEQNIGWVLSSGFLQMKQYPRYKEKITIRTWLSEYSTIRGIRENIIFDSKMNVIGRGKGLWIFFDIKRRRPVPIFDEIIKRWSFIKDESIELPAKKLLQTDGLQIVEYFKVKASEIDMYGHVNNLIYLEWLLDSIPDEIIENCYLYEIEGHFISEVKRGDKITITTRVDRKTNTICHTIRNTETGKICASAITNWKKRKQC